MTKKPILFIGIIGSVLLFLPAILNQALSCYQENWFFCNDSYRVVVFFMLPLLPVFFLSLLTYRMNDEVFRAWWNPARLWIPVIILATLITSAIDSQSGSNIGDFPISPFVLGTLYLLFVSSSLWNIIRTYRSKGK